MSRRRLTNWTKYPFLSPDYLINVKWKGYKFPSISHAMMFASIDPCFSLHSYSIEKLAKKIRKSKNLSEFNNFPKLHNWYSEKIYDTLWLLNLQKFEDKVLKRKLLDLRKTDFIFNGSYSDIEKDYILGGVFKDKKLKGQNLYGRCLNLIRDFFTTRHAVLITGSRSYDKPEFVFRVLENLDKFFHIEKVVHGGASGADQFSNNWAKLNKRTIHRFDAKWNDINIKPCVIKYNKFNKPYNSLAGFNRNKDMAEYLLELQHSNYQILTVGFEGNHGTIDMITKCFYRKIPVIYEEENKMKRLVKIENNELSLETYIPSKLLKIDGTKWFKAV